MPSLRTGRCSVDMEIPRHSSFSTPFRKVEVLYLLGRGAQQEHPHMINVQYAAHQPDVKDRLIALRGNGMPDSFSWSYKRKYKDTFIWCDLFDDDFILPLADSGEYVLKAIELFEALQDASDEEIEFHSARESLPIRSTPRLSSLSKSSRPSTDSDVVSMARNESLFLNGDAVDVTSNISMDLSKQIWNDFSHSNGAPEYRSIDQSNVSCRGKYPDSFEKVVANKYIPDRQGSRSVAFRPDGIVAMKRFNSSPRSAYRESVLQRYGNTGCKELADGETPTTTKLDLDFSSFPASSARSVPARRRTWEKEVDKITIYTDLSYNKSSDDERPSPRLEVPVQEILREPDAPGSVVAEESFLYLLRKATRLGSFRPRLCRGVDVIDSTRIKTPKMLFRSKAKNEVNKLLFKNPVKQARSSIDDSSRNYSATSFPELVGKNQIGISEKTILTASLAPEKKKKSFPDKSVKEFKTLAEYFESKERNSPTIKLVSAPHSVAGTPRHHLTVTQLESRPHGTVALATELLEVDALRPKSCSSGNGALDVTHRKTMEVLAQLSTSRRAGNAGAVRSTQGAIESSEAGVSPVTQGEAKKIRSESKGHKQDVKVETGSLELSSTPSSRQALIKPSSQEGSTNTISKQRLPVVKEPLGQTNASSDTSTGSHQVEAAANPSDEERIETPRFSTKHFSAKNVNIASLLQRPGCGALDSRTLHNGNKQGMKTATQVTTKGVEDGVQFTPLLNSSEGEKGWPFDQPVRPRDFKSREDRPLIPGLTRMDWEKSFQEAAMHSESPVDLVLHECSQCGRTFKLDSLQVHMRGCHAVKKPKPSLSQKKRLSL